LVHVTIVTGQESAIFGSEVRGLIR